MTELVNPHLAAGLAKLPTAQQALVIGGSEAESSWLSGRGWVVTTAEGDLPDWTPEPEHYDLVVCLYVPFAGTAEGFVVRMGNAVRSGGTLFLVSHLKLDENQQSQASSDDAIAALADDPWDIYVAEDRERATGDGVDSVFHAEKS